VDDTHPPVRKDPDGKPVDLKSIFDGVDTSVLSGVQRAIAQKDHAAFVAA
jgi:hypothetical protein